MGTALHTDDTIAAIASAPRGAARGVVRISGPQAAACLLACFTPDDDGLALSEVRRPTRLPGTIRVAGDDRQPPLLIPGALFFWPSERSYTRQPSAEFHTVGSPPLLAAILEELGRAGVRPAGPGEFTLRAFLAGRIDLTQAEAVLGVIDAQGRKQLDAALDQLAGGLSRPLHAVREQLLWLLAELEASLDFVEEDIEFINREALRARLEQGRGVVEATLAQLGARDQRTDLPQVALVGPPNAGKSSLFNALVQRYGAAAVTTTSIVSPMPGATRDYLVAQLMIDDVACELVDTAGEDGRSADALHGAAQSMTAGRRREAAVRLRCLETCLASKTLPEGFETGRDVVVTTKADLAPRDRDGAVQGADGVEIEAVCCSAWTGEGIEELAAAIRAALARQMRDQGQASALTAARCRGSLAAADQSLAAALELVEHGGDELVAAEVRVALDALGEVVGAVCADDVLDRVFSQFCIGK